MTVNATVLMTGGLGGGDAASSAASDDAPGAADIAMVVAPPAITWRRVNFIPSSQLGTVTSWRSGKPRGWMDALRLPKGHYGRLGSTDL
ncbi:hypothetical protein [Stenotrophomonas sp. C2852]|uniref:hypothetical protein n=1 Tax=Stenotrophomonas sp. C2852 TaxID=3077845 RepID=UPI00293E7B47|nr:hypothetical protein [Stenotrophomonas sp. C2852]